MRISLLLGWLPTLQYQGTEHKGGTHDAQVRRMRHEKCARLIKAHRNRCRHYADWSVGNAALYNEELGFMGAAEPAKRAEEEERRVDELAEEERSRAQARERVIGRRSRTGAERRQS